MKPSVIVLKHLLQHDPALALVLCGHVEEEVANNFAAGCIAFALAGKPIPYSALPSLFVAVLDEKKPDSADALCYLLRAFAASGLFARVDKAARTVVFNTQHPDLLTDEGKHVLAQDAEARKAAERVVELAAEKSDDPFLDDRAADACYALLTYKSPSSHVHSA